MSQILVVRMRDMCVLFVIASNVLDKQRKPNALTSKRSASIPQGNQLFHPLNLLTDYLKQTDTMEPLITDC